MSMLFEEPMNFSQVSIIKVARKRKGATCAVHHTFLLL